MGPCDQMRKPRLAGNGLVWPSQLRDVLARALSWALSPWGRAARMHSEVQTQGSVGAGPCTSHRLRPLLLPSLRSFAGRGGCRDPPPLRPRCRPSGEPCSPQWQADPAAGALAALHLRVWQEMAADGGGRGGGCEVLRTLPGRVDRSPPWLMADH